MNKAAFWNSEVKQVHKVRQNTGFFFFSNLFSIRLNYLGKNTTATTLQGA